MSGPINGRCGTPRSVLLRTGFRASSENFDFSQRRCELKLINKYGCQLSFWHGQNGARMSEHPK